MKFLMQFGIIMGVTLLGDIVKGLVPLPVPAAVWGMLLMFLLLLTGVVKLEQVEGAANYLLEIMPILFVPVTVSVIEDFGLMKDDLIGILLISAVTTLLCFSVTGLTAQWMIQKKTKGGKS